MLLSNTESLAQRIVVLPTGTETKPEDIQRIGDLLREAAGAPARVVASRAPEGTTVANAPVVADRPASPARPEPELEVNPRWSWAPFRNRAN